MAEPKAEPKKRGPKPKAEKKPLYKSRQWPFTWNNYTQENAEGLLNLSPDLVRYICFGYETGESGTPHLQGWVEFQNPVRVGGAKVLLDPKEGKASKVHIGDKDGKPSRADLREIGVAYCKKGEQSHEEWEKLGVLGPNFGKNAKVEEKFFIKPRAGQGARTDWKQIRDFIEINPNFKKVFTEFPEYAIKYHSGIQKCIDTVISEENERNLIERYKSVTLRRWQDRLLKDVSYKPDDRKIIWYVDEKGGKGKTWIAKYLIAKEKAAYFTNGKTADIAHAYKGERVCIFDFPRSSEEQINYGVVEKIKDGIVFASKYDSKTKVFDNPHVVVFSNFRPNMSAMSADRWDIREISEADTALVGLDATPKVQPQAVQPKVEMPLVQRGNTVPAVVPVEPRAGGRQNLSIAEELDNIMDVDPDNKLPMWCECGGQHRFDTRPGTPKSYGCA